MGIIEDVKADLLDGIRLAERLVEAIAGSPAEGGIESDIVAGCPFEDDGVPDSGANECGVDEAAVRSISVRTFPHSHFSFDGTGWYDSGSRIHIFGPDDKVVAEFKSDAVIAVYYADSIA
jgi:hypothetical protein